MRRTNDTTEAVREEEIMLPYTKFRLKGYFWLAVIVVSTSMGLSNRGLWWVITPMFVFAVAAAYEYGVLCEDWRYRDVAEYLRRNGFGESDE